MSYLFTFEFLPIGYFDIIVDTISDNLLDPFLSFNFESRIACQAVVLTTQVIVSSEIKSKAYADFHNVVRKKNNEIE